MTANVLIDSFTKQVGTGNQDISIPIDLTAAPANSWAILFWTTGSDQASNTYDPNALVSIGFVINDSGSLVYKAVGAFIQDNAGVAVTSRYYGNFCIVVPNSAGSGVTDSATFVSFPSSTTMRINWGANGGNGYNVNYAIITGLTDAFIKEWDTPTVTGNNSETGVGFVSDIIFHISAHRLAAGAGANARLTFGVMNAAGEQVSNSFASQSTPTTMNSSRWMKGSAFATVLYPETVRKEFTYVSMDADGFTVNMTTADADADLVASLCLKGVSSKIGIYTHTASTETVASNHNFTPEAILLTTHSNSALTPVAHATWSLGGYDGTNERASLFADQDNVGTSTTDSMWSVDKSLLALNSFTGPTARTMDITAMDSDSFDLSGAASLASDKTAYIILGNLLSTSLIVADTLHGHTVDNLALTQAHTLVVADALHAHAADNIVLSQAHTLAITDGLHAHTADNLTLTQAHALVIADALHGHSVDNLTLTQLHSLVVADALHAHTVDNLSITSSLTLIIADATHTHDADNIALSQAHLLAINNAVHAHSADNLTLTTEISLIIQEALHAHTADNVILVTSIPVGDGGTIVLVTLVPKVRLATFAPAVELRSFVPGVLLETEGDSQ